MSFAGAIMGLNWLRLAENLDTHHLENLENCSNGRTHGMSEGKTDESGCPGFHPETRIGDFQ